MGPRSNRRLLGFELREGELQLVVARCGTVILDLVLHEGDAFAFHGPGDHGGWSAFFPGGPPDRRGDLGEVVPAAWLGGPVERLPLLRVRLSRPDVRPAPP